MSQAGIISVAASTPGVLDTLTGNSGPAVVPDASHNINVVGGTNIQTSGAASTLTVRSDIITYVQPGAYPYNATPTDYFISVDTSVARTIRLPNAPPTGKTYVIKDRTGGAGVHNITVTTVGGVVLIDGQTSQLMNDNFQSIEVVFNGTSYEIF